MPVTLDSEWVPLKRYSHFEFGATIDKYTSGFESLLRDDPPSESGFLTHVRARYRSEDLDCDVEAVNGIVHRITVREACLFQGINLIGSKVAAVFGLLGVTHASTHVPEPDDPLEWIGAIPALGFEFQVMCETNTVVEATLRPALPEYLQRERLARRHLGLSDALRPSLATGWISPIFEIT